MKLLTLNCHSWFEDEQDRKLDYLAEGIKEHDYDVIALQEVSNLHGEENPHVMNKSNYVTVLLQKLEALGVTGYHGIWSFSHFSGPNRFEEGSAILTKHKIVSQDSFVVTQDDSVNSIKSRRILEAKIHYNGKIITVYSCHMGWWHDQIEPFKYQADQLLSHMKEEEHIFIMGDFNNAASVSDEGYDYLLASGFYDTYTLAQQKDEGITVTGKIAGWEKNKEDLRIDLILTNQKLDVVESKVIFNGKNHPVVSDHFGVHVEIV